MKSVDGEDMSPDDSNCNSGRKWAGCVVFLLNQNLFIQVHHPQAPDGTKATKGQRIHLQLWDTAGQERLWLRIFLGI